jgi:hypothetical protein
MGGSEGGVIIFRCSGNCPTNFICHDLQTLTQTNILWPRKEFAHNKIGNE